MKVLEYLHQRDPSILQRLHDQTPEGRRKFVAQSPDALYPNNPGFADRSRTAWAELSTAPGWFVDVNRSAFSLRQAIENACEMAGVKLGTEIIID